MLKKSIVTTLTAALVLAVGASGSGAMTGKASADSLRGAGATFPFPLISKWIPIYDAATGVHIDYNPIGSGGGIQAITNRTVDFGASDAPLTTDQFSAAKRFMAGDESRDQEHEDRRSGVQDARKTGVHKLLTPGEHGPCADAVEKGL